MGKKSIAEEMNQVKSSLNTPVKKYRKKIREVYDEVRESLEDKPKYNIDEESLVLELFGEVNELTDKITEEVINIPIQRSGIWDFVLEDSITCFDPNCSYELTRYKPINATEGLDFDPTPFREAAILFETTGAFTKYSKDSKPYIDFWNEQKRRCREGYEVNGYRITGDHYFFLNFYRLPVVKEENGRRFVDESFPVFTTEHYK